MARICPLFSGSSGNATYIEGETGAVIVDAGASFKALKAAIDEVGSIEALKGIFITHEHIDHIRGLKPLLSNLKLPLYASDKTLEALIKLNSIPEGAAVFSMDKKCDLGGIIAERFATSHDTEGSSGYAFTFSGKKAAVCTDLGVVTDAVKTAILKSDALLIESNHNIEMLKKGPYPPALKMRILSDKGHLSNGACAAILPDLLRSGTKRFVLGHISRENNTPLLALASARGAFADIGAKQGEDYTLIAAAPKKSEVVLF